MSIQKKIKRILTLLLCGALLFGIVPPAATADELSAAKKSAELSTVSETSEVVSLREENIKHFDMGDGTYQAIVYSHPVHELDEDGNWQDIDFSLSLTGTRGNQKYINKAAGVAFADRYEAGKPVMSLSKDGNAIDMTLLSASTNSVVQRASSAPIAAEIANP